MAPMFLLLLGGSSWLGFATTFRFIPWSAERLGFNPATIQGSRVWAAGERLFPGLGKEFMPPLDER